MLIPYPNLTARDAMARFAATQFQEARRVAEVRTSDDGYARFRLVDGVRWYVCRPVSEEAE